MSTLDRLANALDVFKQMDPDLPMSVMVVFLAIALEGENEVTTKDLIASTGMTPSSFSRALLTLADQHYSKTKEGLRLITIDFHPEDRRLRIATLTPRGKAVVRNLEAVLR